MDAEILKVKRTKDNKIFELGDQAWVDEVYQGNIVRFGGFSDGFRVIVDDGSVFDPELDEDEQGSAYFSIEELD